MRAFILMMILELFILKTMSKLSDTYTGVLFVLMQLLRVNDDIT